MDNAYGSSGSQKSGGGAPRKKKKRISVGRIIGKIFLVLFTLCVIGVLTAGIFFKIFMTYVNTTLVPTLDVTVEEMTLRLSSTIYDSYGNEMRTIYSDENRELVDLDQIPDHLIDALVAIEDHRFWEHHGVDWEGTAAAFYKTFTSGSTRGGSTLTQQILRQITQDKDVTVKRKVREIFRALEFEKKYTKEDILYLYLNRVYFGQSCYGVQAAAHVYFGKDVSELSLAESAAIVGITNNPYRYDPFLGFTFKQEDGTVKTSLEMNKWRQEVILDRMLELEIIDEATCQAAKAEKLLFTNSPEYAALHGDVSEEEAGEEGTEGEDEEEKSSKKNWYSWFEDAVIVDAIDLVMEAKSCSREIATDLVYSGGYRIYTTLKPEIQAIVDEVYEDLSNFNYPSAKGTQLDSAMTIIDPYTGDVVAMAGGVGEKVGDRILNLATTRRPVGSAIKPLSVYAPAIDNDIIGPGSVVDDYPYKLNDAGTGGYPKNSNSKYRGKTNVAYAVQWSTNTVAARVVQMVGTATAYEFLENKLGFDLVLADNDVSPLSMGSLTYGATTEQMAAAFASFANSGIYTYPRTITRIEDNNGNIIVDNQSKQHVAMKESTAYLMNKMLRSVVSGGTGGGASFSGMTIAGKTGTTDNNFDRYFVGYTPYYSGAVWVGYRDSNERINASVNPAAAVWKKVMEKVHEGLENKSFPDKPSGITSVNICADCGLLPCSLCSQDQRGSRIVSAEMPDGAVPTETCTCHVEQVVCEESGMLAGEYCPEDHLVTRVFCTSREHLEIPHASPITREDGTVETGTLILAEDSQYYLEYLEWQGVCTTHTIDYVDPDLTLPGDPDYEWPDWWPWGGNDDEPDEPDEPVTTPGQPDIPSEGGDHAQLPEEPVEPMLPDEPEEPNR